MSKEITFLVEDYLSESEIKTMIEEELRQEIRKQFNKESSLKRVLSNLSYDIVYKMVDEEWDTNLSQVLKENVVKIINNLTAYSVFQRPDAWSRETNGAYQLLTNIVHEETDTLKNRVKESISTMPKKQLQEIAKEVMIAKFKED